MYAAPPAQMKRGYTHERYRAIIDNIRRYMPDASISGDVIVGFPGRERSECTKAGRVLIKAGTQPLSLLTKHVNKAKKSLPVLLF